MLIMWFLRLVFLLIFTKSLQNECRNLDWIREIIFFHTWPNKRFSLITGASCGSRTGHFPGEQFSPAFYYGFQLLAPIIDLFTHEIDVRDPGVPVRGAGGWFFSIEIWCSGRRSPIKFFLKWILLTTRFWCFNVTNSKKPLQPFIIQYIINVTQMWLEVWHKSDRKWHKSDAKRLMSHGRFSGGVAFIDFVTL